VSWEGPVAVVGHAVPAVPAPGQLPRRTSGPVGRLPLVDALEGWAGRGRRPRRRRRFERGICWLAPTYTSGELRRADAAGGRHGTDAVDGHGCVGAAGQGRRGRIGRGCRAGQVGQAHEHRAYPAGGHVHVARRMVGEACNGPRWSSGVRSVAIHANDGGGEFTLAIR
jgi:hypothetical protein